MKYYSNDIYPIALVLSYDEDSVNNNYTDANGNELKKMNVDAYSVLLNRKTTEYNAMAVGIVFNKEITAKLAAHEGFHAACSIMGRLGIMLSDYSEEAFAYLIGWIAECIDDFKITIKQ